MKKKDLTKIFINNIYDRPPKKVYPNKKTIIKSIDDTWSADPLDLVYFSVRNKIGHRYILVVIDNFSKNGWSIPLKNQYASSIKDAFAEILTESKRKPEIIETNEGKEFANKIFEFYLTSQNIKRYSRYISKGAFLPNNLTELYEIFCRGRYLKMEMLIGLIFLIQ